VSFILDALKKSENERQRQTGPGFAAVPERSRERTRNRWPVILGILVALNLCALAFLAFRDNGQQAEPKRPATAAPAAATEPLARSPQAESRPAQVSRDTSASSNREPSSRSLAEIPVTTSPSASLQAAAEPAENADLPERQVRGLRAEAETTPSEPDAPLTSPPPSGSGTAEPPPTVSGSTAQSRPKRPAAGDGDALPTANDLRLQGFLTGPPLHLDLHVYYPESHRRVVFISGSKYREGDQVGNGPVIREIVPEGVVLEERGRRYLLMPD